MADLRRLDGKPLDVAKLGRNEKIAKMLAEFTKRNDDGRVRAAAIITLTPEGWYCAGWQWPENNEGFPWSMALEGALSRLQAEIATASINSPEMPEPKPGSKPEEPDGA